MDTTRLKGKNVVITGAARGMGAAVAEHYAAQGAKVCVADVNLEGCNEVVERIKANGGEAIAVKVDVTKREEVKAAIDATVEAFGSINVMLNNAGINKPLMFLDVTEENWHQIMNVNALGCLIGMQEAAKQMIKQGKQDQPYKIINVGSILSRQAFDDVVPYSCSKHAVLAMINGGAKALAEHNITVNGYGPGVVRTELWEQLDKDLVEIGKFDKAGESMDKLAENMILLKRYSYPEDVVGTASFLASNESDYMTGQLLMIDGGMVVQ
ncbi:diacetyl reductase [(S)-acetoin forming] [Marinobacterium nitratireducens]|uniref:Diacetyl reductase [(S)-acetoin forming] n=1 Tax=Marinobacterium nitratireducens TaxID=518897 RepID=A0A917ZLB9_9GAMM|nr:SDR family oxidoreductase [Marinobacterium nitratireducens]GGO86326.1 diacetyl reductase [(S)-acetoin forming] [Marinobacterium nitratireducens]